MIKKIIFDVDDTLIMWKEKYVSVLNNILKEYNIYDKEKSDLINHYIDIYEHDNDFLEETRFLNYINSNCNLNLNLDFVEKLKQEQSKCFEKASDSLIETLEYLSSKYELVILTNWWTTTQKNRLKNAGILKYFKEVYGDGYQKPTKEAFLRAVGNNKIEECIMVGDNLISDIKGALDIGMKAIWYNSKNKENKENNIEGFITIKDLTKLKEIL